jgi:uncharacterized membrane-anchored protein
MNAATKLWIGLGILVIIAGAFALYVSAPLRGGTDVVLKTLPIDPFDPLRGQYMTIRYEAGQMPKPLIGETNIGDTVYVPLETDDDGTMAGTNAITQKPSEGIFLRGKVGDVRGNMIDIDFGIEQFFFEKNANVPTENITVHVKVNSNGRAAIVELLQNNEPVNIEYKQVSTTR